VRIVIAEFNEVLAQKDPNGGFLRSGKAFTAGGNASVPKGTCGFLPPETTKHERKKTRFKQFLPLV
jgi:hypothetical protein